YKNLTDYLHRTSEKPEHVNYYAIGRIWKVLSAHRITDMYGDVPYSEAGKGYIENIWNPKYDPQQEIYADMLKELEEAAASLDANLKNPGINDLVYNGEVAKWKKFAYSLMLRLGMRMSKVDPSGAEAWVKKAIAGGVMTSIDDTARILHEEDGYRNPFEAALYVRGDVRLAKTFIDWMETKGDPRLDIISFVASGGPHKGLPNGYDQVTIESYAGGSDLLTYSNYNPIIRKRDSPSLHQTYAEVELLLAEASVRGWHTGNAATHYANGVRAAISQFGIFEDVTVPTSAEIDAYLAANPFDAANALELIGEQYWAATFVVSWEGYSNWRRTGFPVLTPINYPGNATGGKIPRRLTYSGKEYSSNLENVNAANAAQGPDTFLTRVWWDVE
ncbi:MAG TPA: SusD/RagB family nutrient-binding outer membrane lipoprotein, partial [Arenibacter sp.]|nr:SusD/RagB family nutrient-binding outer membrane lipoprotein [Arenibacter sp.]